MRWLRRRSAQRTQGEKWVFCNYENGSLDFRLMYAACQQQVLRD